MESENRPESRLTLLNRRILIAGSSSRSTDAVVIRYAQRLVELLAAGILERGGRAIVGTGKEPLQSDEPDAPALLFDWTVLETSDHVLSAKRFPSILSGPPLTCVTSEKAEAEIPADRRQLWNRLRQNGFVEVEYIRPGARSGAMIRDHQARLGDVLLVLGGGSGVEHLTDQFMSRRLPVIAFDLPLGASRDDGTGGGLKIARETKADPGTYFRLRSEHQPSAGSMYSLLSTRGGAESVESVAEHALQLMEKLERPMVFFTRLVNPAIESYPRVEHFFRKVVDPFVDRFGYRRHEVGLDKLEHAFINLAVFDQLHYSSIVIADLTGERNSCYMELGYAFGRQIKVLMTAEAGTKLPFDPNAIPCHFWSATEDIASETEKLETFWNTNIDRPPLVS